MSRRALLAVVTLFAAPTGLGCASAAWVEISDARELAEAKAPPKITRITELGGMDVPMTGILSLDVKTDGVAVVGELLLVEGDSFGRQPTVQIGERPAAVIGRTANEGILVRVPPGVQTGQRSLVVSHERGRSEKMINLKRFAMLTAPKRGTVHFAEMNDAGPGNARSFDVRGARQLRFSADGRAGYVLGTPDGQLTIFDMTGLTWPMLQGNLALGGTAVRAFAAASSAHVMAVIREADIQFLDTSSPLRPARRPLVGVPPVVRAAGVGQAEMSPDGKLLAFTVAQKNQVFVIDSSRLVAVGDKAGDKAVVASLALAPDVRVPVLNDLAFSPDGGTIWVVAGGNAENEATGPQPTVVYALRLERPVGGDAKLELARTVTIAKAANPVRIATGHSLALASGAGIRLPPEKARVFVTATEEQGARTVVFAVGPSDESTEVLSVQGKNRAGGTDVTPDGRWLLATTFARDGTFRLGSTAVDGRSGESKAIDLPEAPGSQNVPMQRGWSAEIRLQP